MSQHEYSVPLAKPRTPEEMAIAGEAYLNGKMAEQARILKLLDGEEKAGYVIDVLVALRKKIEETGKY